jgi:glutathione S-transferase
LDPVSDAYCRTVLDWPPMIAWTDAAKAEPEDFDELDMEF